MKRKMIACFAAVAVSTLVFGAMSLNVTSASAEEYVVVNETASFEMVKGASVRLNDSKNGQSLSGIRWQTTLNDYYYYTTLGLTDSDEVEFGALVGPASMVGENAFNETTVETTKAEFVPCEATKPTFDEKGNFTYYASITYDDLAEDLKQKAYAVELVARAYVKVNDVYHFVDTYETTRSMRAIALTAVQSGKYEESQLNTYYNQEQPTVNETESGYYETAKVAESSNVLTNVNNLTVGENYSAYVGAQPVTVNVTENGVGVVSDIPFSNKKVGDVLKLNVFDADGNIYTQTFTYATKVFYEASDLSLSKKWSYFFYGSTDTSTNHTAMESGEFKEINVNDTTTYAIDGAYYLGDDIDLGGARIDCGTSFWGPLTLDTMHSITTVGFVGIFDGKGHTISNMQVGSGGMFGVIGGGAKIGNFALQDVVYNTDRRNYKSIFAHFIAGSEESYATLENIYISIAQQDDFKWSYTSDEVEAVASPNDRNGTASILAYGGSIYTRANNLVIDVSAVGDINVLGRGLFNVAYNGGSGLTQNKIGQFMTNTFVVSDATIVYSVYNNGNDDACIVEGANKDVWDGGETYSFAYIPKKTIKTQIKQAASGAYYSYKALSESLYRFADVAEMTDYIKANTACVDSFNNQYWTVDAENGSLVWGKVA